MHFGKTQKLKGFRFLVVRVREAKVSLYMDDLTLFLIDNNYIKKTLQICEKFTLAAGCKNLSKKDRNFVFLLERT